MSGLIERSLGCLRTSVSSEQTPGICGRVSLGKYGIAGNREMIWQKRLDKPIEVHFLHLVSKKISPIL